MQKPYMRSNSHSRCTSLHTKHCKFKSYRRRWQNVRSNVHGSNCFAWDKRWLARTFGFPTKGAHK